ncbi:MAG TPA: uracil-DNA glycosylase [Acidimicrobiia bacterium]
MPDDLLSCRRCPRLVAWRERVAVEKRAAFADEDYWGKPVPGFGDPAARLLVVGLAPAAHGANRTGRMFTGDRSGEWLYRAMHRAGFANRPTSLSRDDGLRLIDARVTSAVKCAPPANRPTTSERDNCRSWLEQELDALDRLRVVVCLGSFAWTSVQAVLADRVILPRPRPSFRHLAIGETSGPIMIGSYHPSQQNTFTGRLTEAMFDEVFTAARGFVSAA